MGGKAEVGEARRSSKKGHVGVDMGGGSVGFAAKMVGIGLCAGLALLSCQYAIELCLRALG